MPQARDGRPWGSPADASSPTADSSPLSEGLQLHTVTGELCRGQVAQPQSGQRVSKQLQRGERSSWHWIRL
jgi:hypothetical protein